MILYHIHIAFPMEIQVLQTALLHIIAISRLSKQNHIHHPSCYQLKRKPGALLVGRKQGWQQPTSAGVEIHFVPLIATLKLIAVHMTTKVKEEKSLNRTIQWLQLPSCQKYDTWSIVKGDLIIFKDQTICI